MSNTRCFVAWTIILLFAVCGLLAQSTSVPIPFSIPSGGAAAFVTEKDAGSLTLGFARILPGQFAAAPSAFAVLRFRKNDVLISETTAPAALLSVGANLYVEAEGPINTGVAIANPNPKPATITFIVRKAGPGLDLINRDTFTIPPNSQLTRFINEPPFNAPMPFAGLINIFSSVPVGAAVIRGLVNERSEFLMTTLPEGTAAGVFGSVPAQPRVVVGDIPIFADGGGWTTQVVVTNITNSDFALGKIEFFGPGGDPINVTADGQTASTFSLPAPGASVPLPGGDLLRIFTSGGGSDTRVGYIRVTAEAHSAAFNAFAILSYKRGGVTVSATAIPVIRPGGTFRMYVEESSDSAGRLRTGLAISNAAAAPASVLLELLDQNGQPTGFTGTVVVPGLGHVSRFLNELPGLNGAQLPFRGTLRISTEAPEGISVVGLRGRSNERSDFLFSAILPETPDVAASGSVFPHVVEGSGYSTEFVLVNGASGASSPGELVPVSQNGILFSINPR